MTFPLERTRIGGEFEFTASDYFRPAAAPSDDVLAHSLWTDTGRSALLIVAGAIERRGGVKRVWLPAYCCASIAQPFRQRGFEVEYYAVGPCLFDSESPLPHPRRGETLLFIDYFGHRNTRMVDAAAEYRSAGVWIIEDRVQAGLARPRALAGHFAVTSDRKLLPVPDGALVAAESPLDMPVIDIALEDPDEAFISAKIVGAVLRDADGPADAFLSPLEAAEARLDGRIVARRRSWLSEWMTMRLDRRAAAERRRENWSNLMRALRAERLQSLVAPIISAPGDGDVPLGVLVRVAKGQRDRLRRFLAERRIYCPVHWPLDHVPAAFSQEHELSHNVLTLPIDQRMSSSQLAYLVDALTAFAGGVG